jgi:hypothetical protein
MEAEKSGKLKRKIELKVIPVQTCNLRILELIMLKESSIAKGKMN